jgi:hypothetical protein
MRAGSAFLMIYRSHGCETRFETKHAEPAPKTALERFKRQVDSEGTHPDGDRLRRVAQPKKAYFTDLASKSARARTKARGPI